MRILVSGGAGFVGSAFVRRRLAATGDSVLVVDKLTYAGNPANLAGLDEDRLLRHRYRFVQADIADEPLMKELAAECDAIVAGVRRCMRRSIATGGSSISDFVAPDGSDGHYQDERRVYARAGQPCRVCATPIRKLAVAQRSSHYCPDCQR